MLTTVMEKELFKTIIRRNQSLLQKVRLHQRDIFFEPNGNYVLVGVRHGGKSYMLYQRALQLLEEGVELHRIVFVNFDDERLFEMSAQDFDLIIQVYESMYVDEPIFFFDEIQNIKGWEHFARRLANEKYRVFITGSNAKMLSRDVATVLGERYLTRLVFPYSFKEFLLAKGVERQQYWMYGPQRGEVERHFNEYFEFGGFPETMAYIDKRKWLNSLFERIFFSDMVVRNKVRNEEAVRMTVKRLAENVKQPTSYNRIANLIKSTGYSVTVTSISDYVRYMQDACFLFSIENYRSKFVEKETVKKHYFVDNGLLNIFLLNAEASLLENICAIHLYRKFEKNLYYFKMNEEVDFYIPSAGLGVQVAYSLRDEETRERELKGLKILNEKHPLKRMMIITRDEKDEIMLNPETKIEVVPVWQWLLEDDD